MSIQTGLRIRWPPVAQQTKDVHEPQSLTAVMTRVTRALAQTDVCMDAFVGYSRNTAGEEYAIICLPTSASAASAALKKAGMQVEEVPLVLAWLPDTIPNLVCACEVLETARVRVDLACLIRVDHGQGRQVAFLCDDAELADRLLWAMSY